MPGPGRLKCAVYRFVTCSPLADTTLYMHVRGRAPSIRRKADAPMRARREVATTLQPSVFYFELLGCLLRRKRSTRVRRAQKVRAR